MVQRIAVLGVDGGLGRRPPAERLVPVQAAEAMSGGLRSRLAALTVAGAVALGGAGTAQAHVQIDPTEAAPGDPTTFELLVPGETEAHTIEVALRIPDGVLPFSFEREPGWHRQLDKGADGSVSVVRWHGQLARDGFVRFAFLASTPDREGDLVWKVIQRYDDGEEAAWIGPPDSDRPAAVTRISASAARQNAGGEAPAEQPATAGSATPPAEASSDGGGDTVALALGAAGLLLGAAALAVALRRRRPRPRAEAW
jgi:uncharacterized protein YcnI